MKLRRKLFFFTKIFAKRTGDSRANKTGKFGHVAKHQSKTGVARQKRDLNPTRKTQCFLHLFKNRMTTIIWEKKGSEV